MVKILASVTILVLVLAGCDGGAGSATVSIKNDFNDPAITTFQPPWTICKATYMDVEFGKIAIGATSGPQKVEPGLDYVLMVAAWNDPDCSPVHCLPIATSTEEEVVDGQTRTINVAMANHQGPCPPEGVPPIPQAQYDRILKLYPEYGFKPYDQRTQNTQCAAQ